ncbi:hypothetical protein GGR55DRAFT_553568 [Xylaria sp. FL0064]|nr:hypothetical protein GGR55DRAFT_553568 [Xylaria sp. FL0064]
MPPQLSEMKMEASKEQEAKEKVTENTDNKLIQKALPNLPNSTQIFKKLLNDPKSQALMKPYQGLVGICNEYQKRMVSWVCRPPGRPDEGAHLEWPGYTGVGLKLDFKLEIYGYKSKCLVENTIFSFYPGADDLNLTPKQLQARAKIISLYTELEGSETPVDHCLITKFMRLFDQYFFFGAMANKGCPPRTKCVVLEQVHKSKVQPAVLDVANNELAKPLALCRTEYIRGLGPFCKIHIMGKGYYKDDPTMQHSALENPTLQFFLENLIHEMVHAYITLFMCRCKPCSLDTPNTDGFTGHGPAFVKLLACIDQTLITWDVGLRAAKEGHKKAMEAGEGSPLSDQIFVCCMRERQAHLNYIEAHAANAEEQDTNNQNAFEDTASEDTAPWTEMWPVTTQMSEAVKEVMEPRAGGPFRPMKGLNYTGNDTNVCFVEPFNYGARVNPDKVWEAADVVQALLERDVAKPNAKVKSWAKNHLVKNNLVKNHLHWPKLGKKSDAKVDEKYSVHN